jgi:uncharacterized protein
MKISKDILIYSLSKNSRRQVSQERSDALKTHIIVGIDPGNTIAIACLSLDGRPIFSKSFDNEGITKAVSVIEEQGTPSLIATDVRPAPSFAIKLSSYFNARLFVPKADMREDEKRQILKRVRQSQPGFGKNNHERDALAAAITAYKENQNSLRSILSSNHPLNLKYRIAHLVLQGHRREDALLLLNNNNDRLQVNQEHKIYTDKKKRISTPDSHKANLLNQIEQLKKRVVLLEQTNSILETKIREHERTSAHRIYKEKIYQSMKLKILRLEQRLKSSQKRVGQLTNQLNRGGPSKKNPVKTHLCEGSATKSLKKLDDLDSLEHMVSDYRKNRSS